MRYPLYDVRKKTRSPIQVDFLEDVVVKTYLPDALLPAINRDKFQREINAYKSLKLLNAEFVPDLLSYDKTKYSLTIERIMGGDLCSILEKDENIDFEAIISQLVKIDDFLFKNQINYLNSSPKDVVYDNEENKIYIIDFEYTFVNEPFQQILFDCMFHARMMRVTNTVRRDHFLYLLKKRRSDFTRYYYRKIKNRMKSKFAAFFYAVREKRRLWKRN